MNRHLPTSADGRSYGLGSFFAGIGLGRVAVHHLPGQSDGHRTVLGDATGDLVGRCRGD